MDKHTPGPWETSSNAGGDWDVCEPDAGDMIADLQGCENAEANARLIAAAPRMREWLASIVDHTCGDHAGEDECETNPNAADYCGCLKCDPERRAILRDVEG